MIIDTNSRISPGLLPTPAKNKAADGRRQIADGVEPNSQLPTSISQQTSLAAQNIASAISPVQDAQAARAAIQAARQNFLANPGSALLAQANQLPENALQLLQ